MRLWGAILFALTCGTACVSAPTRPDRPPAQLVARLSRTPPTRPGLGRVIIDAETTGTYVYRRTHGRIEGLPLCRRAPCVVDLPLGRHELVFSYAANGTDQALDRAMVSFRQSPAIYVRTAERYEPCWPELLAGIPVTGFGVLLIAAGLSLVIDPYPHAESGSLAGLGYLALGLGGAVATVGALLIRGGIGHRPAHGARWVQGLSF